MSSAPPPSPDEVLARIAELADDVLFERAIETERSELVPVDLLDHLGATATAPST